MILIWTAVGLLQAVPDTFREFYWPSFAAKIIEAWTWAVLTPAVLLIDRNLTARTQNLVQLTLYHLVLSVPISLFHTGLSSLFEYPIEGIGWNPLREPQNTRYYYLGSWMVYCSFVGIVQAFKFYDRFVSSQFELERAEKKLVESHLNALRFQLEPHFLFNALNTISSEAKNPKLVRQMIEGLGALLRRSLDCQDRMEIALEHELVLLDHYLSIQKLRFGKRIEVSIDVDPAMQSVMVPSMLLQPLIENSIRHGLESRKSGGAVALSAKRVADHLEIRVVDDGVGLPPNWRMEGSSGLGLNLTRQRLEALYPGSTEHCFTVAPRAGGGTEVTIHIPLHRIGGESHATAA